MQNAYFFLNCMILKKALSCAVTPVIADQTTRRNIRKDLNLQPAAYPRILFGWGGGGSTNLVEDREQRERGFGGGSPLVRGSGGSCNFVQEISFHIVKFS